MLQLKNKISIIWTKNRTEIQSNKQNWKCKPVGLTVDSDCQKLASCYNTDQRDAQKVGSWSQVHCGISKANH